MKNEAPKKRGRPRKRRRIKNPSRGVKLKITPDGKTIDEYQRVWSYNEDKELVPTGEVY
jgi:hypothetical protein